MKRTVPAAPAVVMAMLAGMMLVFGGVALGQSGGQHDHAAPAAPAAAPDNAAVRAYKAASDRMHRDMTITYSGNADIDFARGMIPHHQGAIDMARIALEHGTDPDIRKLAQDVIAAQESEIAFLRKWLAQHAR